MAAGKIFANSLERRRQKFHIVCLLLWLRDTSSKFTNSKVCWLDSTQALQVPGGRMAEMYGTKKVLGYRSCPCPLCYSSESWKCLLLSMLITAILGFLAPLAAYTSYYFIFAILVAQVVSRIFVSCLAASSDNDHRASVRELHIPPWTHIFQDGFQVASEAGSTQHAIKPRLLYFNDISDSLLLYSSAALQEQFWHCLLAEFSSTIIRGR